MNIGKAAGLVGAVTGMIMMGENLAVVLFTGGLVNLIVAEGSLVTASIAVASISDLDLWIMMMMICSAPFTYTVDKNNSALKELVKS